MHAFESKESFMPSSAVSFSLHAASRHSKSCVSDPVDKVSPPKYCRHISFELHSKYVLYAKRLWTPHELTAVHVSAGKEGLGKSLNDIFLGQKLALMVINHSDCDPSERCIALHALGIIRLAEKKQWIDEGAWELPEAAWLSFSCTNEKRQAILS